MRNKKIIVSLSTIMVIAVLIVLISSFAFAETDTEVAELTEVTQAVETEDNERVCPVTGEPCTGENYGQRAERQAGGETAGVGEQNRQRLRDGSCAGDPEAAAERQQNRRGSKGRGQSGG